MGDLQGMLCFKYDFKVQTAENSVSWKDDDAKLGDPRRLPFALIHDADRSIGSKESVEGHIQDVARTILRHCYTSARDATNVTNYNFSQKLLGNKLKTGPVAL